MENEFATEKKTLTNKVSDKSSNTVSMPVTSTCAAIAGTLEMTDDLSEISFKKNISPKKSDPHESQSESFYVKYLFGK